MENIDIKQLYEDYEKSGIIRVVKSGKLQEVSYGNVEFETSSDKSGVDF